jgi:sulfoxide reductase heme-binding subunit YedZ
LRNISEQLKLNSDESLSKWLVTLTHISAAIPLLILLFRWLGKDLGFNPIQEMERFTGRAALIFLILSLAITPLRLMTKQPGLWAMRKHLGLYAFKYALLHLVIYLAVDLRFDWQKFFTSIISNRFFLVGSIAFVILLALAITSAPGMSKRMRYGWYWLHRLVYVAAALVLLHFAWVDKGNLLAGQGNLLWLLIAVGIFVILMLLRVILLFPRKSR